MSFTKKTQGIRWCVEYCSEIPVDEFGDSDHDNAVWIAKHFQSLDAAKAYMATIRHLDAYGCARLHVEEIQFAFHCERNGAIYEWECTESYEMDDDGNLYTY